MAEESALCTVVSFLLFVLHFSLLPQILSFPQFLVTSISTFLFLSFSVHEFIFSSHHLFFSSRLPRSEHQLQFGIHISSRNPSPAQIVLPEQLNVAPVFSNSRSGSGGRRERERERERRLVQRVKGLCLFEQLVEVFSWRSFSEKWSIWRSLQTRRGWLGRSGRSRWKGQGRAWRMRRGLVLDLHGL